MGNYYRHNPVGEIRENNQSFADIVWKLKEKGYSSRQILCKIEDYVIDTELCELGRQANMILRDKQLSYKEQYVKSSLLIIKQVERWSEVEIHLWFEEKVFYQIHKSLQRHKYSSQEIEKIIEKTMGFQLDSIPSKPEEPYKIEFPYWFPDGYFMLDVFYNVYRKDIERFTTEWTTKLLPLLHDDGKKILKETFDHPYLVITKEGTREERWYNK